MENVDCVQVAQIHSVQSTIHLPVRTTEVVRPASWRDVLTQTQTTLTLQPMWMTGHARFRVRVLAQQTLTETVPQLWVTCSCCSVRLAVPAIDFKSSFIDEKQKGALRGAFFVLTAVNV